jgi:biopolymer transport protein ExbB
MPRPRATLPRPQPRLRPPPRRPRRPKAAKSTEVVDNPYGLEALWRGSDVVAKATLVILIIMSMGTWYIIITKIYEQYKVGRAAARRTRNSGTRPRSNRAPTA